MNYQTNLNVSLTKLVESKRKEARLSISEFTRQALVAYKKTNATSELGSKLAAVAMEFLVEPTTIKKTPRKLFGEKKIKKAAKRTDGGSPEEWGD